MFVGNIYAKLNLDRKRLAYSNTTLTRWFPLFRSDVNKLLIMFNPSTNEFITIPHFRVPLMDLRVCLHIGSLVTGNQGHQLIPIKVSQDS